MRLFMFLFYSQNVKYEQLMIVLFIVDEASWVGLFY